MFASVGSTYCKKCQPWILNLVKQRLYTHTDEPVDNQPSNTPKYVCKILQMNYTYINKNTPFIFGVEMTLFDGQTAIPAYFKVTKAKDTLIYRQYQQLDLRQFILQFDHNRNNFHILIFTSELVKENILFNNNYNFNEKINTVEALLTKQNKSFTIDRSCTINNLFPFPIFKNPTYSLITNSNCKRTITNSNDMEVNQVIEPPTKKSKLSQNSIEFDHIAANNQLIQKMLKYPLLNACSSNNDTNNKSTV